MKSVQLRSFFWSLFSCFRTEYRKIRTRKNSEFGHFWCSAQLRKLFLFGKFCNHYVINVCPWKLLWFDLMFSNFVLINKLRKKWSMIETRRLTNIFFQTIISFLLEKLLSKLYKFFLSSHEFACPKILKMHLPRFWASYATDKGINLINKESNWL